MEHFPSWRYHRDKEPVLVKNHEEEKALGSGWVDSPAKFKDHSLPTEEPVQDTSSKRKGKRKK